MEMLKGNNWLPWKRRMLAVLRDLDLEQYIKVGSIPKAPLDPSNPTKEEIEAKVKWQKGNAKTRTRIELSISDSEMIHISGAKTASEMWKQLTQVKESKGKLGILAIRRYLYRTTAEEGIGIIEYVAKLRKLQEELHLMRSVVGDEDFTMVLLSSLPESWMLIHQHTLEHKSIPPQ
jgi:gag-polypeptide of LTR copia-type